MDELRVIWPLLLIGFGKRNTTAEQPKITMGVGEAGKLQVNANEPKAPKTSKDQDGSYGKERRTGELLVRKWLRTARPRLDRLAPDRHPDRADTHRYFE